MLDDLFSAPLSNVAGTITDLIPTAQSGYAIALYALASVAGPALGSVTGGYPVEKLGWRWLFWIYAIVFGVHLVIIWAFMPETRENIGKDRGVQLGFGMWLTTSIRDSPTSQSPTSPQDLPGFGWQLLFPVRDHHYLREAAAQSVLDSALCVFIHRAYYLPEWSRQCVSEALFHSLIPMLSDSPSSSFALGMIFLSNEAFPLIFGRGNNGHLWTS